MRRVTFKSIREKASALYLGNPTANAKTVLALDVHLNKRAAECWEKFFWPELGLVEERTFRAPWDGATAYAAGAERYHRPSKKYAVALTASTNQAPYTYANGGWTVNAAYWGASAGSYTAADYVSTTAYVRGDQAYYPETDQWYALFAATSTGNAPTDPTKWGALPRLKRNVAVDQSWAATVIGEFENIWEDHPELNAGACEIKFTLGTDGAAIVAGDLTRVWVEFRKRAPSWTGSTFSSTATYNTVGTQVYDDTLGDYYISIAAAGAGSSLGDTTKWTRLDFPYVFRDAVPQLAYADLLRGDGMNEKAHGLELGEGWRLLRNEFDKIERQQKQHRPLNVKVRF